MSCRRQANVWESYIHERPLRAPNNGVSPFEKLLQKDRPATIHQTNWELLVPELFKVKNNISKDSITYFLFKRNNVRYSFRSRSDFSLKRVKSEN